MKITERADCSARISLWIFWFIDDGEFVSATISVLFDVWNVIIGGKLFIFIKSLVRKWCTYNTTVSEAIMNWIYRASQVHWCTKRLLRGSLFLNFMRKNLSLVFFFVFASWYLIIIACSSTIMFSPQAMSPPFVVLIRLTLRRSWRKWLHTCLHLWHFKANGRAWYGLQAKKRDITQRRVWIGLFLKEWEERV